MIRRRRLKWSLLLSCAALGGCGGGAPLLHPAHTLPSGQVSAGAGLSGNFALGDAQSRIVAGEDAPLSADMSPGAAEQKYFEGRIAKALLAPGIAPWLSARAGLGGHNEGGMTYTGRSVRLDARHAFEDETWALSIGGSATAIVGHADEQSFSGSAARLANAEPQGAKGFGFEIPVLVGARSAGSIFSGWAGMRVGFERLQVEQLLVAGLAPDYPFVPFVGRRWYAGPSLGAAMGLKPFWVAIELDVAYHAISAEADFSHRPTVINEAAGLPSRREAAYSGFTIVPAAALIGKF